MHKFLIKRAGRVSSGRFCRMLGQFGLQLVTNDSMLFERLGGDYSAADSAEIVFSSCIWRKRADGLIGPGGFAGMREMAQMLCRKDAATQ